MIPAYDTVRICIGSYASMDLPPAAEPLTTPDPDPERAAVQPAADVTETAAATHQDRPPFDLTAETLEAQDEVRWNGRMLSELSDPELVAVASGLPAVEAPAKTLALPARERSWLKLHVTWPEKRLPVTLRVDAVALDWFRRGGPGFQARMNAVLRAYVEAQINAEAKRR
jgi:uncharacterized protein (DUF4415 family)